MITLHKLLRHNKQDTQQWNVTDAFQDPRCLSKNRGLTWQFHLSRTVIILSNDDKRSHEHMDPHIFQQMKLPGLFSEHVCSQEDLTWCLSSLYSCTFAPVDSSICEWRHVGIVKGVVEPKPRLQHMTVRSRDALAGIYQPQLKQSSKTSLLFHSQVPDINIKARLSSSSLILHLDSWRASSHQSQQPHLFPPECKNN